MASNVLVVITQLVHKAAENLTVMILHFQAASLPSGSLILCKRNFCFLFFFRVDFNVPMKDHKITNNQR